MWPICRTCTSAKETSDLKILQPNKTLPVQHSTPSQSLGVLWNTLYNEEAGNRTSASFILPYDKNNTEEHLGLAKAGKTPKENFAFKYINFLKILWITTWKDSSTHTPFPLLRIQVRNKSDYSHQHHYDNEKQENKDCVRRNTKQHS